MIIGYSRTSTADQAAGLADQQAKLKAAGVMASRACKRFRIAWFGGAMRASPGGDGPMLVGHSPARPRARSPERRTNGARMEISYSCSFARMLFSYSAPASFVQTVLHEWCTNGK